MKGVLVFLAVCTIIFGAITLSVSSMPAANVSNLMGFGANVSAVLAAISAFGFVILSWFSWKTRRLPMSFTDLARR